METQVQCKLYKDQKAVTEVSLQQPAMILIENRDDKGFLFANETTCNEITKALHLFKVHYIRFPLIDHRIQVLEEVVLGKDDIGIHVVKLPIGKIIREPSIDPYAVIYLNERQVLGFKAFLNSGDSVDLAKFLTGSFAGIPGFAVQPNLAVQTPEKYARAGHLYSQDAFFN